AAHGGRLSRNALRRRADGADERYLTLRVPGLGRASADARFAALEAAIEALPVTITRRVREHTVYDSNLALDRRWTAGAGATWCSARARSAARSADGWRWPAPRWR